MLLLEILWIALVFLSKLKTGDTFYLTTLLAMKRSLKKNYTSHRFFFFGWLVGWLVGWLTGWLFSCLMLEIFLGLRVPSEFYDVAYRNMGVGIFIVAWASF